MANNNGRGLLVPTEQQNESFMARMANDNLAEGGFSGAPAVPEATTIEDGMFFRFYPEAQDPKHPQPGEHHVRIRVIGGNTAEYCGVITFDPVTRRVEPRQFYPRATGRRLTEVLPDGSTKIVKSSGKAAEDLRSYADYNQAIQAVRKKLEDNNAWIRVKLERHEKVRSSFRTELAPGYTGVYEYVDETGKVLDI